MPEGQWIKHPFDLTIKHQSILTFDLDWGINANFILPPLIEGISQEVLYLAVKSFES